MTCDNGRFRNAFRPWSATKAPRTRATNALVFMPGLNSRGGAERYALALAADLHEMGYRVTVATTGQVDLGLLEKHYGLDLTALSLLSLPRMPRWAHWLPQAAHDLIQDVRWAASIRDARPDLFVNCLYRSELPGLGRERNVLVCHFPHTLHVNYRPWTRALYMRAVHRMRCIFLRGRFPRTYDTIVANSQYTALHISRRWAANASVLYPPCPAIAGSDSKTRSIISVGRFEPPAPGVPNKRFDVLVDTFVKMRELHEEGWTLHLAGACSPSAEAYVSQLRAAASGAPINFHPNASFFELQALYGESVLYWHAQGFGENHDLHPESQEHFGMTTVEAMSAGVIPLVYGTAGPLEVVEPLGGPHQWHTLGELGDMTRAVLGRNPDQRSALSKRCIMRAADFSPEVFRSTLDTLLHIGHRHTTDGGRPCDSPSRTMSSCTHSGGLFQQKETGACTLQD